MTMMKIVTAIVISCVLLAGCKLAGHGKNGQRVKIDVVVEGIDDPAALASRAGVGIMGSIPLTANVDVFVKVFQESTRIHLPDLNDTGALGEGKVAQLSPTPGPHWKGTVDLDDTTGNIILLAYAVDKTSKQHLYAGSTIVDINAGSASIGVQGGGSQAAYLTGDCGPGGGWVFIAQNSYTEGASTDPEYGWRYMEMPSSYWYNTTTGSDPKATNGTVGWGPSTYTVGTSSGIGTGKGNTITLNAATYPAAYLCGYNRTYFNAYKDWFLPSAEELDVMATYLPPVASWYWSSSDDTGGANKAWGYLYTISPPALSDQPKRNRQAYVRPARRF